MVAVAPPASPASAGNPVRADLRRRFASGSAWSLGASVIYNGSILLTSVLTARVIGASAFGEFGLVQNTVGMFGVLAGMGLGVTATKHVAECRRADPRRAGRIVALTQTVTLAASAAVATALLCGSDWLAAKGLGDPNLGTGLRLGVALMVANSIAGVQNGILAGFEAFRPIAILNTVRGVACPILTVAGAAIGGVNGALAGLAAAAFAGIAAGIQVLSAVYRAQGITPDYGACWTERLVLWQYSLPALVSAALSAPALWLLSVMLAAEPGGYAELGVFNAASQWRNLLLFVPAVVGSVLTPLFASVGRDLAAVRLLLWRAMLLNGAFAGLIALPILLFGRWVLELSGPEFQNRGSLMAVTAASGVLLSVQTPVGNLVAGAGRMWAGAAMNAGWALALILAARLFLQWFGGAEALASAILVAYLVHAMWTAAYAMRFIRQLDALLAPFDRRNTCL